MTKQKLELDSSQLQLVTIFLFFRAHDSFYSRRICPPWTRPGIRCTRCSGWKNVSRWFLSFIMILVARIVSIVSKTSKIFLRGSVMASYFLCAKEQFFLIFIHVKQKRTALHKKFIVFINPSKIVSTKKWYIGKKWKENIMEEYVREERMLNIHRNQ